MLCFSLVQEEVDSSLSHPVLETLFYLVLCQNGGGGQFHSNSPEGAKENVQENKVLWYFKLHTLY